MLVLDANILIRAVLGMRVLALRVRYGATAQFFAPESAFEEAREHLPAILAKRGVPVAESLAAMNSLSQIVQPWAPMLTVRLSKWRGDASPAAIKRTGPCSPRRWP